MFFTTCAGAVLFVHDGNENAGHELRVRERAGTEGAARGAGGSVAVEFGGIGVPRGARDRGGGGGGGVLRPAVLVGVVVVPLGDIVDERSRELRAVAD
jgi:hypothetical protein